MIGTFHTPTCFGGATIDLDGFGFGRITLPRHEPSPVGFKDNDRVKITLKINEQTNLAEWDMELIKKKRKTCLICRQGAIFPDTHFCAVCNAQVYYDRIMQLSYEQLSDKIEKKFKICDVSEWQDALNELIQKSGWTIEEWEKEVFARYEKYETKT